MIWHDIVRWADDFRHFMAYSFSILNWVTNASEQIVATVVVAFVTYLVWPKFRKVIDREVATHLKRHHEAVVAPFMQAHHDELKQHVIDQLGGSTKDGSNQ